MRSRTFAQDRRTWIATIAVAGLLWFGTSAWLNRRVSPVPRAEAEAGDDGRFLALAYDRIGEGTDGRSVDRIRLREQLRGLAADGWQPVTLEDLRLAYRGIARLPARPILLTFDEGYLGTYEAADPVLRELRWPAVMFLKTDRQELRDVSFLFWDRLRRMAGSGLWEIASGDAAPPRTAAVPPDLPEHPPGALLITDRLDLIAGAAWAPRGADPLVALGVARPAHDAGRVPWLGFVDDPIGANDPSSDPFRVGRLRVDPAWTTAELLRRARVALSSPRSEGDVAAWVAGEGASDAGDQAIRLEGRPRAEAWIPAARWTDDWRLDAEVSVIEGEFWIAQPGALPGHEWRVGGTSSEMYVETRVPGAPPTVLARRRLSGDASAFHHLTVIKRGSGASVRVDGSTLGATPLALPDRTPGRVTLIAYAGGGEALSVVRNPSLHPVTYRLRAVSTSPEAGEIGSLAAVADELCGVSPPWVQIDGESMREGSFDSDLFKILSRRYAWDIVPTISVRGYAPPGPVTTAWLAGLPERLRVEGWGGVRLDLDRVPAGALSSWDPALRDLNTALKRSRLRLVRVPS